ncbi:MAG: toll/interleukin-1 receptor domain-containing protein [Gemmatimonadota bacterium]
MAHDVFISYSSNDQQAALAVLHALEDAGIRCWIAPRDIEPGAIWAQAIMEGISGSRVLVVVFSANANRSPHVINEVDAAVRKGAIIVPYRIEDVMPDGAMEYHLRTRHWLDALTPDLERHTSDLAVQVGAILRTHTAPPSMPTPPPRPMPKDLPPRRSASGTATTSSRKWLPTTAIGRRRLRIGAVIGGTALVGSLLWRARDHAVGGVAFTVREVSGSGNNQSSIRMTSGQLRFFEAGESIPLAGQRSYATKFLASTTRFIDVEVALEYEAPNRNVIIPIACNLTSRGGQVITALTITARVQPSWTSSLHVQGWGTAAGGSWKEDRYRVECRYGDKVIGRNWFEVTTDPKKLGAEASSTRRTNAPVAEAPPWHDLQARVSAIRTFAMSDEVPPISARQTTTVFPAATTGYVGVEVTMAFTPPGRPLKAQLNCRVLRDRTQVLGQMTLSFDIGATWESAWAARGYGRSAPGFWQVGTYLMACDDGRRTLAQTAFEIR